MKKSLATIFLLASSLTATASDLIVAKGEAVLEKGARSSTVIVDGAIAQKLFDTLAAQVTPGGGMGKQSSKRYHLRNAQGQATSRLLTERR